MSPGGTVAGMEVTVLDGGMGRELDRIGAPFRQPEWSALTMFEAPEFVTRVHESYVAAGAQVITTNAYALVPFHLGDDRFASDGRRLAALAGHLAREVADRHPGVRVAGCLPPVMGSYRPDLFTPDAARPLARVLVEEQAPFVDLWLAETQSSIAEVQLMREVLDASGATQPLWCSFTLTDSLDAQGRATLRSGESVTDAARAAAGIGAEVVSFNCSPPEVMEPAIREAREASDLPIAAYANAFVLNHGEGANESLSELRDDMIPAAYTTWAGRWIEAGASIVGGCCGVGADHVSALSRHLSAR
jgi:S-methylmethionine-dependent homocysteine/selenocysteine methylase